MTRDFQDPPARVFAAFADPAAKVRWFVGGYQTLERTMNIRDGGRERLSGCWPNGMVSGFEAIYVDVTADFVAGGFTPIRVKLASHRVADVGPSPSACMCQAAIQVGIGV